MYRKLSFVSNSKLVGPYCDTLWTDHESGENLNLSHNIIKREVKLTNPLNRKIVSKKCLFQWFSAPQNMTERDEGTTQIVYRLLAALYCVNIISDICTM
jgi:hypothetical protein